MNRNNLMLSLAALLQVVIVAVVFWSAAKPVTQANAPLVSASSQDISSFSLYDESQQRVTLSKVNDVWVLPDRDNFPANEFTISTFLNTLTNLSSQGLIARNASSYDRLSVSDSNFVRKIELSNLSGKDDVLYLGTAPRASAVHIRSSSSPNVYLTGDLRSSDVNTNESAWIDTNYLSFSVDNVTEVNLSNANGDFSFSKENDVWSMQNQPPGENFNSETLINLLGNVANLRMQAPLKLASNDAYGTDQPVATLEIKTLSEVLPKNTENQADSETTETEPIYSESSYRLSVGQALENAYAVKASTSDYVVSVSSFSVEDLINHTTEDFMVQEAPQEP